MKYNLIYESHAFTSAQHALAGSAIGAGIGGGGRIAYNLIKGNKWNDKIGRYTLGGAGIGGIAGGIHGYHSSVQNNKRIKQHMKDADEMIKSSSEGNAKMQKIYQNQVKQKLNDAKFEVERNRSRLRDLEQHRKDIEKKLSQTHDKTVRDLLSNDLLKLNRAIRDAEENYSLAKSRLNILIHD